MKDLVAWLCRALGGFRSLPAEQLPNGPAIYYANHSSHLDFVIIWATLPEPLREKCRPVAGRDYWTKSRFHRWLAQDFFQAVLIERQHVTVAANPLGPMLAALEAGCSLIVFPEGTRSADGTIGEFKSGLYHLARARPDARLVPVYLQNLNRILPKGDFLPVPLLGSLSLGVPFQHESTDTKAGFLQRARHILLQLAHDPHVS